MANCRFDAGEPHQEMNHTIKLYMLVTVGIWSFLMIAGLAKALYDLWRNSKDYNEEHDYDSRR